jgi:hypothetical protein
VGNVSSRSLRGLRLSVGRPTQGADEDVRVALRERPRRVIS